MSTVQLNSDLSTKLYLDGANIDCDVYSAGTVLDLLNVDTTGNSSSNRKYLFETGDASNYINSPINSGAFIGKREVIFMYPKRLLVIVTEFFPIHGRIWYNHYNYGEWSGWRSDLIDIHNHKTSSDHDGRYYTKDEINSTVGTIKTNINKSFGCSLACNADYGYPAVIACPAMVTTHRNQDNTYDIHISVCMDGDKSLWNGNANNDIFTLIPIKNTIQCNRIEWHGYQSRVYITGYRNYDTYKAVMDNAETYFGRRGLFVVPNPDNSSFCFCRNYGLLEDVGSWGYSDSVLYEGGLYYSIDIFGARVS